MKVKPVLGSWEIPSIASISALDHRAIVELPVPGRVGSLYQDMNSTPTRISISGSLYGDEKRNQFLEDVRSKFRAGEPLTFVADIITATDVQYVLIETMSFVENGTDPDQTEYSIILKESPPPPPPPSPLGEMDAGLLDDAKGMLDSVTGAMDVIDSLGNIPDISNPFPSLKTSLDDYKNVTKGLGGVMGNLNKIFGFEE